MSRILPVFPALLSRRLLTMETTVYRPVQDSIEKKLKERFNPVHLQVINDSYKHAVPKGSESHFNVVIVSDQFETIPLLQRHQMVMSLLSEELENGVHALSIQTKTVSQWEKSGGRVQSTPPCLSKK